MKVIEYIGKQFNDLKIIEYSHRQKNKKPVYICLCKCGNYKKVRLDHLKSGAIKHCGCKRGKYKPLYIYNKWRSMIKRCYNVKDISYHNYGGRGIKVCDEWKYNFDNFKKWYLEQNKTVNITIDRINNNGDYSPENCRFATYITQNNNKRNNRIFYINGEKLTLMQICRKYNIKWSTISNRLRKGWSIEKSINTPIDMRYSHPKDT